MNDAPERIWTDGHNYWANPTIKRDKTEYTRSDVAHALVAAALREAAAKTALMPTRIPADPRLAYHAALDAMEQHILALITQDASAALDKLLAEARREGRREGMKRAWREL